MYPKGLRLLLQYIKLQYKDPLIYITENGELMFNSVVTFFKVNKHINSISMLWILVAGVEEDRNDNVPISEALKDYTRKKFFFDHLCCLREAIE